MKITEKAFLIWLNSLPEKTTFDYRSNENCANANFIRSLGAVNVNCGCSDVDFIFEKKEYKNLELPSWLVITLSAARNTKTGYNNIVSKKDLARGYEEVS